MELEELRNKCKKMEQNVKEQQKNITAPSAQAQESPNGRKFLNRSVNKQWSQNLDNLLEPDFNIYNFLDRLLK